MRKYNIIILLIIIIAGYFYLKPEMPFNIEPEPISQQPIITPTQQLTGTFNPEINLNLELYKGTQLINKTTGNKFNFTVEEGIYTLKYSDPTKIYYNGELTLNHTNSIQLEKIGQIIILKDNKELILDTLENLDHLAGNFKYISFKITTPNNTILKNVKIKGVHKEGLAGVSVINRGQTATINRDLLEPTIIIDKLTPADNYEFEYRLIGKSNLTAGNYNIKITADDVLFRNLFVFWTN